MGRALHRPRQGRTAVDAGLNKRGPWLGILSYASSWSRKSRDISALQAGQVFCHLYPRSVHQLPPPCPSMLVCDLSDWMVDASRREGLLAPSGTPQSAQGLATGLHQGKRSQRMGQSGREG